MSAPTPYERAYKFVRPRARNDLTFLAVLDVLMQQVGHLEELLTQLGLLYSLSHSRAPLSILDQIGALLELPRQASWSKEQYRTLLRARIRARRSHGTYDEVKAIANLLRRPGTYDEANVTILHPEALQIAIPNPGPGAKSIKDLLLGAIQETTELDVVSVPDSGGGDGFVLTLSDPDLGLGKKLATTL